MIGQLAIMGCPGTGKTTLADRIGDVLGVDVLHTDVFAGRPWAESADAAYAVANAWHIVEGITVARLFRRGYTPDCVIYLIGPGEPQMQSLMANGIKSYKGRLIRLPSRPTLIQALKAIGGPHGR